MDLSSYPKILKTKEDYLFVRKNFPDRLWIDDFLNLEVEAVEEVVVGFLEKTDNGFKVSKRLNLTDPIDMEISRGLTKMLQEKEHWLVASLGEIEGEPQWSGYTLEEDDKKYFGTVSREKEDSKMKRLGFTLEELRSLMQIDMGGIDCGRKEGAECSSSDEQSPQ